MIKNNLKLIVLIVVKLSIEFMLMNKIIKVMLYICHIYYILLQYKNNTPPRKLNSIRKVWRSQYGEKDRVTGK